jgi:4-amino-4-deoxy-L-arabinose transferase-like glycosyltransferase
MATRGALAGGQLECWLVRRSALPLILLAALTFFAGLGRGAITDADEAFYAEAAREMVEGGDWITPHYNYEHRFQKPILFYWLAAGTFLVTGPGEAPARLWAALAGLGLALVTAACGRRWYDDGTGLLAGAIVATSFGYFALGRTALPDLPLAFFITVAIFAGLVATLDHQRTPTRWVVVSAAAIGLGFLTKGPLGVIIPALVLVPVLLLERRSIGITAGDLLLGSVVFLAIALPWYLTMWLRHGTPYLEGFFIGDNFDRFATDRFNDPRPWWFYGPVILGGLLPWTPLAVVWVGPIRRFIARRGEVGTIDVRLLMWVALPLVFFTLSVGKQPRYILPVLPPLAILLAASVLDRTREWRSLDGARVARGRHPAVLLGGLTVGLLLVGLAVLLWRAQALLIHVAAASVLAAVAAIALLGAGVVAITLSGAWRAAPGVIALASALTFTALQYGALTGGGDDAVQQMARLVRQHGGQAGAVGSYQVMVRNLIFYTGIRQQDLWNEDELVKFLARPDRVLAVIEESELNRVRHQRGVQARTLASVAYFNESGIRLRTLFWPEPARDIQRVLLVSNRD